MGTHLNILTFDIEDWYNCDFITSDFNWDKYEVRIYDGVERILRELENRKIKATFFCLGWIAQKHPDVIRWINDLGHHIGCHSYQHELSFRFDRKGFKEDTKRAKLLIEDLTGKAVEVFRAPGFSITKRNLWAFEVLVELGFEYDCSILPTLHDYGGFPGFGNAEPVIVKMPGGAQIKELPMNTRSVFNKNIVFSGGGYFRIFPYWLIKYWMLRSPYLMSYFHPRDFDPEQPVIDSLPLIRKFKSYVGLRSSFRKFKKLLDDFIFVSVEDACKSIDWSKVNILTL